MNVHTERERPLVAAYAQALQSYLHDAGEPALHRGYELARRALVEGRGVLDIAEAHRTALRAMLVESPRLCDRVLRADCFFAECLSPFEMSHRAAQDGGAAFSQVNEILEAELRRVAHALHDEAGQLLASVHLAIADLAGELGDGGQERLQPILGLLNRIELELRNLSHELRPTLLDDLGLLDALQSLAERVAKRSGLDVSVVDRLGERLPPTIETALYRIVQEAMNNAVKHARAGKVEIELRRKGECIACSVRDDGIGFDPMCPSAQRGLGLGGIRARVRSVGGWLHVSSEPGRGTTVLTELPLGRNLDDALSRTARG
jgi:signal transduction histidine kinase